MDWSESGDAVVIFDTREFTGNVLMTEFDGISLGAFKKYLARHGFESSYTPLNTSSDRRREFKNPHFKKGSLDLSKITRGMVKREKDRFLEIEEQEIVEPTRYDSFVADLMELSEQMSMVEMNVVFSKELNERGVSAEMIMIDKVTISRLRESGIEFSKVSKLFLHKKYLTREIIERWWNEGRISR